MNIKYKYGDIEVHYEDVRSATRIEQDKEIMDIVYNNFLKLYNLKKQEESSLLEKDMNCLELLSKCRKATNNG